jgi:hypothetical protein
MLQSENTMFRYSLILPLLLFLLVLCGTGSLPFKLTASSAPAASLNTWWSPTPDQPIHWHWQLSDDFVYPRDVLAHVTVYDLDGELTSAQTVS